MRTLLLIILTSLLFTDINAQTTFSNVQSALKATKVADVTQLVCASAATVVKFQLKRSVEVSPQNNLATIDSQAVQITFLKPTGFKAGVDSKKSILEAYSNYEMAYFKNNLGVTLINPGSQWVVIKSKGWLIWYFKVGDVAAQVGKQTKIQLFATTIIGEKNLVINAPIFAEDDFTKAGLIVNDMMETCAIIKP
jgi:hypothetical protein